MSPSDPTQRSHPIDRAAPEAVSTLDETRALIEAARVAHHDDPWVDRMLTECADRLDEPLRLALAGSLKAGKSTLLNALVGQDIAPTDATECTRVVTWYRRGVNPKVTAHYDGDRSAGIPVLRRNGHLTFDFGDLTAVVAPGPLRGGAQVLVGVYLPYNRIFIIALSIVCVLGIYFALFKSNLGLRVRAVTQNRNMSACLGIPTRKVDSYTFAFGSGLAGIAGWALTMVGNVDPGLGQNYIVDAFMVVVTGGVGKLAGTIVASLGIGGLNKLIEPGLGAVYGKVFILVMVILFLQWRPSGLFAMKGRNAD